MSQQCQKIDITDGTNINPVKSIKTSEFYLILLYLMAVHYNEKSRSFWHHTMVFSYDSRGNFPVVL